MSPPSGADRPGTLYQVSRDRLHREWDSFAPEQRDLVEKLFSYWSVRVARQPEYFANWSFPQDCVEAAMNGPDGVAAMEERRGFNTSRFKSPLHFSMEKMTQPWATLEEIAENANLIEVLSGFEPRWQVLHVQLQLKGAGPTVDLYGPPPAEDVELMQEFDERRARRETDRQTPPPAPGSIFADLAPGRTHSRNKDGPDLEI